MKVKSNNSSAEVHFTFRNDTKGALRYQEVNENGKVLESEEDGAKIGALYFRKANFADIVSNYDGGAKGPKKLTITVTAG